MYYKKYIFKLNENVKYGAVLKPLECDLNSSRFKHQ